MWIGDGVLEAVVVIIVSVGLEGGGCLLGEPAEGVVGVICGVA